MAIDRKSTLRSVFLVWNNPEHDYTYKHNEDGTLFLDENGKRVIISEKDTLLTGLTPGEQCERVVKMWCETKPGRTGACIYCISAEGLHHLHAVLECDRNDQFRYAAVQDLYQQRMHLEPTRGNKQQAEDYIRKQGKWEEKGETIVASYQHGEIKGSQGNRSDLDAIAQLLDEGKTPSEIMKERFSFRKYEKLIRDAYFAKRSDETPFLREVKVYWHFGETGTGKTYTANQLWEELGSDHVYPVCDYANGGLDHYCGQEVLFMDEFRGQWPYGQLLSALQGYKFEMHARQTNTLPLWNEVHITSPFTPDEVYHRMVYDRTDSVKQLLRRITEVVHHWKDADGYHSFSVSGEELLEHPNEIRKHINYLERLETFTKEALY